MLARKLHVQGHCEIELSVRYEAEPVERCELLIGQSSTFTMPQEDG